MGREETIHNKINRRRRSQIWHQWYDGRASTTVKCASYKDVEFPNLTMVTVLSRNKCVLKTQGLFFFVVVFGGIDYQKSPLCFSNLLRVPVVPPVVSKVIVKNN